MDRMKTFFIYFLLFAGLFIVLNVLENGLTSSMFSTVKGTSINNDTMSIEVTESKASNVNGYMNVKITNDSKNYIKEAYAKVDLIDEYGFTSATKYVTVEDLNPGDYKDYRIRYKGNNITGYNIEFVSEIPDKSKIINILGWEFDATNIFGTGIDLTDVNGYNLAEDFSLSSILRFFRRQWNYGISMASSVPVWGYILATLVILLNI